MDKLDPYSAEVDIHNQVPVLSTKRVWLYPIEIWRSRRYPFQMNPRLLCRGRDISA